MLEQRKGEIRRATSIGETAESYDAQIERFESRNAQRGWGFTPDEIEALKENIKNRRYIEMSHSSPWIRTLDIWRGGSLERNMAESIEWLRDEADIQGVGVDARDFPFIPVFRPGSEREADKKLAYSCFGIIASNAFFEEYHDPPTVHEGKGDRRGQPMRWPGLEIIDFLALNPRAIGALRENAEVNIRLRESGSDERYVDMLFLPGVTSQLPKKITEDSTAKPHIIGKEMLVIRYDAKANSIVLESDRAFHKVGVWHSAGIYPNFRSAGMVSYENNLPHRETSMSLGHMIAPY